MATMNQSNEDLLQHHAGLLANGRTDSAAALTRGASVNKDTVALMNVAANVHAALPSVTPEPGFRSRLESQITAQARSAQRVWTGWR